MVRMYRIFLICGNVIKATGVMSLMCSTSLLCFGSGNDGHFNSNDGLNNVVISNRSFGSRVNNKFVNKGKRKRINTKVDGFSLWLGFLDYLVKFGFSFSSLGSFTSIVASIPMLPLINGLVRLVLLQLILLYWTAHVILSFPFLSFSLVFIIADFLALTYLFSLKHFNSVRSLFAVFDLFFIYRILFYYDCFLLFFLINPCLVFLLCLFPSLIHFKNSFGFYLWGFFHVSILLCFNYFIYLLSMELALSISLYAIFRLVVFRFDWSLTYEYVLFSFGFDKSTPLRLIETFISFWNNSFNDLFYSRSLPYFSSFYFSYSFLIDCLVIYARGIVIGSLLLFISLFFLFSILISLSISLALFVVFIFYQFDETPIMI